MSGETFYGLREMVLPGPSQTSGYRTILLIGTTGAGKSTLIRQLMGTIADGFPATSASKTTVAEAEVLLAPGDYYATATFMPLIEVRSYLEENVLNAALAIFDERPPAEIRNRLLDHVDQRFRLSYLLGPGGERPDGAEGPDARRQLRQNTDQIVDQLVQLLGEAVNAEVSSMVEAGGAEDMVEDELTSQLRERLGANETVQEIVDFLVTEIRARVELLCPVDVVTSRDGWPLYWRAHRTDRAEMLAELRKFNGNDAADFGTLLTPLINGLRVRGPFHPRWAPEIPYVMLVDREGLGHTPDSVSSLPSATTRMLDEVDSIIIVDNAQQPMQAAPVAAMRQIAAAGHGDKLILCFTHFELVHGPNLPDVGSRRSHVIASVDQVLTAIGNELGFPTERLLRQRLDQNLYLLSRLHTDPEPTEEAETLAELRWLLGQLRVEAAPLDLGDSRPVYRRSKLTAAIDDAIAAYLRFWELRLGVATDPTLRPAHWSKIKALCVRYARRASDEYEQMRPAGDLLAALTDTLRTFLADPERWRDGIPDEDTEQQIYDALTREVAADLRRLINDRLFLDAAELWAEARDVAGPNAAEVRSDLVYRKILEPLVGAAGKPFGDYPNFPSAVVATIRERADELEIEFKK